MKVLGRLEWEVRIFVGGDIWEAALEQTARIFGGEGIWEAV